MVFEPCALCNALHYLRIARLFWPNCFKFGHRKAFCLGLQGDIDRIVLKTRLAIRGKWQRDELPAIIFFRTLFVSLSCLPTTQIPAIFTRMRL